MVCRTNSWKGEIEMNTLETIAQRRSIRRFKPDPIPEEVLRQILRAATQAPSGKNRQPWQFVVVRERRDEMIQVMQAGLEAFVRNVGPDTGSARWTLQVMAQAPVTVFVFNPYGKHPFVEHTLDDRINDLVNLQSVGAAIQNICLAAHELGLGSLWICDILYAYDALRKWMNVDAQMVAALSLGYPDESPGPRPRRPLDEVTTWM